MMTSPKTFLLTLVLTCIGAPPVAGDTNEAPQSLPERYTAQYTMHAYGTVVGRARTRLSAGDKSGRVYEQSSWPEGVAKVLVNQTIFETTRWTLHDGKPRPNWYERRREGRKPRTTRLAFDWTEMQVSGERKNVPVSTGLREGTHDKMTYILALMLDLASASASQDLSYEVTDGSKTKIYRFTPPKSVKLDTALGALPTLEVRRVREDGERETTFWFAPTLAYVPVQIEHKEKGEHVTARIESLKW